MARGGLKHVEDAVEIGRKHLSPFFLGAIDEGAPAAAADAGIGETAVDAAERIERRLHRGLHGSRVADVANAGIDLAGQGGHGCGRVSVLLGVAAPDRDVAATGRKCLRDAEPDAAIAAGDDGCAAGEVEDAHLGVSIWFGACSKPAVRPMQADVLLQPWTRPSQKSNMGTSFQTRRVTEKARIQLTRKQCSSSTSRSISMGRSRFSSSTTRRSW